MVQPSCGLVVIRSSRRSLFVMLLMIPHAVSISIWWSKFKAQCHLVPHRCNTDPWKRHAKSKCSATKHVPHLTIQTSAAQLSRHHERSLRGLLQSPAHASITRQSLWNKLPRRSVGKGMSARLATRLVGDSLPIMQRAGVAERTFFYWSKTSFAIQ